jgi:alkylation response protein AidB-like acyl-CoA dehydrogenase
MEFNFSESQQILINSARGFLEKGAKDLARKMEKTEEGYSREIWAKMADLGWMGIVFPEEYGGSAGNFLDLTLLLREIGRALVPGPFISTILSGLTILQYGSEKQKSDFLPPLIGGKTFIAPALIKPNSLAASVSAAEQVKAGKGFYRLSGTRLFIPYGQLADGFLYLTEKGSTPTLFLVDAKSSGIKRSVLPTIASDRQCELVLDKVEVPEANWVISGEMANEAIRHIKEWGALLQCAFILGMLEKVLNMTVEHAKQREQFGKIIGTFQAIQIHCAEMATAVDKVKFLTYEAAWMLSEGMPAAKVISMAKAKASDAARTVCLLGIKVHGGIGISEEHDMQLYFRRAKAAEVAFGDGDFHREMVAQQIGL